MVMLGALLRGWQYPHRTPGVTALQVSVIAVHALLLVLPRRQELWLRLREPLFVVIQVVRIRIIAVEWTCLLLSCTMLMHNRAHNEKLPCCLASGLSRVRQVTLCS